MTLLMLLAGCGFLGWKFLEKDMMLSWVNALFRKTESVQPLAPQMGQIKIVSDPEGATVFDGEGRYLGETQTSVLAYPVGTPLKFTLRKSGYQELQIEHLVKNTAEPDLIGGSMKIFSPPIQGEPWQDHLGIRYLPEEELHVSQNFLSERDWKLYTSAEKRPAGSGAVISISENGKPSKVVLTTAAEAELFCRWHQRGATPSYLTPDQEILPRMEKTYENPAINAEMRAKNMSPFRIVVRDVPYGSLHVVSVPEDVEIYVNEVSRGRINGPTLIDKIRPGAVELMFLLDGYKPQTKHLTLENGQSIDLKIELQPNQGVVFGRPWENALGMKFVPLGDDLMVSAYETRIQDFALYVKESRSPAPPAAPFSQEPDHPVVNIKRDDAVHFCEWLTQRERKNERIQFSHEYRLPTDREWSLMAGLDNEKGNTPGQRDSQRLAVWPWGKT